MTQLSTHVLDIAHGIPAQNMRIELYIFKNDTKQAMTSMITNINGRTDLPLLQNQEMRQNTYEMHFFVAEYFQRMNKNSIPTLFDIVPIRFSISEEHQNYHIPLLISPWAYSTYRGS
ncbi:MAG: 5-hydroxyisourate hydrolase [Candidatus Tokpelaia sp. JSC161]|jgi:5-hydroxyisourate hydrolase|nr:MAG: 5-hydroxyisourate hydrolase [Candidatus Tokpelaia sp. JSC161]